jgi:hypothetical protein
LIVAEPGKELPVAGLAEGGSPGRRSEQTANGSSQFGRLFGIHEEALFFVLDDFGAGVPVSGDDGQSVFPSFEENDAEAFATGGHDEGMALGIDLCHGVVVQETKEVDASGNAGAKGESTQVLTQWTVANEEVLRTRELREDGREGLDYGGMAFVTVFGRQAGNGKQAVGTG